MSLNILALPHDVLPLILQRNPFDYPSYRLVCREFCQVADGIAKEILLQMGQEAISGWKKKFIERKPKFKEYFFKSGQEKGYLLIAINKIRVEEALDFITLIKENFNYRDSCFRPCKEEIGYILPKFDPKNPMSILEIEDELKIVLDFFRDDFLGKNKLFLDCSHIKRIPDQILDYFTNVASVKFKKLSILDERVCEKWSKLKIIDLSDCDLKTLPKNIDKSCRFNFINVNWNEIEKLPKEIMESKNYFTYSNRNVKYFRSRSRAVKAFASNLVLIPAKIYWEFHMPQPSTSLGISLKDIGSQVLLGLIVWTLIKGFESLHFVIRRKDI